MFNGTKSKEVLKEIAYHVCRRKVSSFGKKYMINSFLSNIVESVEKHLFSRH
jgi:hypothetical protein